MMKRFRWLVFFALLLACSEPAFASQYRGASWGILFVFYTLPFTLIPIGLSLLLTAFKLFRRSGVYYTFVLLATLLASFFTLLALQAPGNFSSSAIAIVEIAVILALTLLAPWLQHSRSQRPPATSVTGLSDNEDRAV